ncbi:MAG: hypothetical protein ABL903_02720 [Methylococcales bacterium]
MTINQTKYDDAIETHITQRQVLIQAVQSTQANALKPESRSFLLKIFSGILLEKICKNLTRRFILLRKPRFVLRPPAPTRQGDRRIAPTMT